LGTKKANEKILGGEAKSKALKIQVTGKKSCTSCTSPMLTLLRRVWMKIELFAIKNWWLVFC